MNFFKGNKESHGEIVKKALAVMCLGIVTACATKHEIRYDVKDVPISTQEGLKDKTFNISYFTDGRDKSETSNDEYNRIRLAREKETGADGKKQCFNKPDGYKNSNIANPIAELIAQHFRQRAAFKSVSVNLPEGADFTLAGKIERFDGRQEFSHSASMANSTAGLFGLLGGLIAGVATANIQTNGVVYVKLSELKILDKNGSLVKALPDVEEDYIGHLKENGTCLLIYSHVDERLKAAVQKLAEEAEQVLSHS